MKQYPQKGEDQLPSVTTNSSRIFVWTFAENKEMSFAPFFGGANDFPALCRFWLHNSTTHSACVQGKRRLFIGDGLNFGRGAKSATAKALSSSNFIPSKIEKAATDFFSIGTAFIHISKRTIGGTTKYYFDHLDAFKCRAAKDGNYIGISETWTGGTVQYDKEKHSILGRFPLWSEKGGKLITDSDGVANCDTVVMITNYTSGNNYYGLPDYYSANHDIKTEIELSALQYEQVEGGLTPSSIIQAVTPDNSTEERIKLERNIRNNWTRGNGKKGEQLIIQFADDKDALLQVGEISKPDLPSNSKVFDQIAAKIIIGHGWSRTLASIQTEGKLSNSADIVAEYSAAISRVIAPARNLFLPYIQLFFQLSGFDIDVTFSDGTPVSFAGAIEPAAILTINEQRELLGYEPVEGGNTFLEIKKTAL